jgi:hypothetical protein
MKALVNFLNPLLECAGESDPDIGESASDRGRNGYVCSFTVKDLRHNGTLSLIVGLGDPIPDICRGVDIVDRTRSGFEIHRAGGNIDAGDHVSSRIKDLRGDGSLEYISDNGLVQFDTSCWVSFPSIYGWTGHDYTNVSRQFKDFYGQKLDSLKRQISEINKGNFPNWYVRGDEECLLGEVALIERFLGISPNAGLDHAMQLAKSKYDVERYFGSWLLEVFKAPEFSKSSIGKASGTLYREAVVKPDCLRARLSKGSGRD